MSKNTEKIKALGVEVLARVFAYGCEALLLACFAHLALPQFSFGQVFGTLFVVTYLLAEKIARQ